MKNTTLITASRVGSTAMCFLHTGRKNLTVTKNNCDLFKKIMFVVVMLVLGSIPFHASAQNIEVMFVPNNDGDMDPQQMQPCSNIRMPENPTYEGHNFFGWYNNETFSGTSWIFGNQSVCDDTTLYAKWEIVPLICLGEVYQMAMKIHYANTITAEWVPGYEGIGEIPQPEWDDDEETWVWTYATTPEDSGKVIKVRLFTDSLGGYCTSIAESLVEFRVNENSCRTTVLGTVFPFVNWNYPEFDHLFTITANLKSVPNPQSTDPIRDLIDETPLYSTEAIYYNGSLFVPNSPKSPGMVGALNNYGLPINWEDAIHASGSAPVTNILAVGEQPVTINGVTLGLFKLEDVAEGDYILEIKREGFVTRWAKVTVNANERPYQYLEHREIVAGDLNNEQRVTLTGISAEHLHIGGNYSVPSSGYVPKYDFNSDGQINQLDYNLIVKLNGFWYYHYEETQDWLEELGIRYK